MKDLKVCVVGLGYVGLPLAYNFAKQGIETWGYDVREEKLEEYRNGVDRTEEVGSDVCNAGIKFTSNPKDIGNANYVIVAVPTPTINGTPELKYLELATKAIGENMSKGAIVVYESTVYPFCTERFCLKILKDNSDLVYNEDFFIGFSPERISPGDKVNKVTNITKIVAGSTPEITKKLADLYKIVTPNIFEASSISVAESAKILENSQRDVNIALLNQFAMLYPDISTREVVDAMNTKWNSLGFTPGLVGGHCIAEDPNYFTGQCRTFGKRFSILEESRNINESVAGYIVNYVLDHYRLNDLSDKKVLIKGFTFKSDVPDVRNTKASDVYKYLLSLEADVDIYDPIADEIDLKLLYNIELQKEINDEDYDVIIYTVGHKIFEDDLAYLNNTSKDILLFDIPSLFYKVGFNNNITYKGL